MDKLSPGTAVRAADFHPPGGKEPVPMIWVSWMGVTGATRLNRYSVQEALGMALAVDDILRVAREVTEGKPGPTLDPITGKDAYGRGGVTPAQVVKRGPGRPPKVAPEVIGPIPAADQQSIQAMIERAVHDSVASLLTNRAKK